MEMRLRIFVPVLLAISVFPFIQSSVPTNTGKFSFDLHEMHCMNLDEKLFLKFQLHAIMYKLRVTN